MDSTTQQNPSTHRVRSWWLGQPGVDPHATEPWTDPSTGQRYLRTIHGWVPCCEDVIHTDQGTED